MKGKHAKNTANKQKLAKRMLALCFAVVFLCSCVLPVFATGSSLLTDALREAVEETAASTDTSTEAGGGTMMDDFQSMVSSSEYKTTYRFWLSEKDSYDLPDAAKTSASDLEGYADFYAVAAIVNNTTLTAPEGFQNPADPTGEGRTFKGWYYIDTYGMTQTFTFDDSPVLLDKSATIDVFAQWGEAPAADPADDADKAEGDTKADDTATDDETASDDETTTAAPSKAPAKASLIDDMAEYAATVSGTYTIKVGDKKGITGKAGYRDDLYSSWESSNTDIVSIYQAAANSVIIEGEKAGNATITHQYLANKYSMYYSREYYTVTVEAVSHEEPATVFIMASPNSNKDSNITSAWGAGIINAKIDVSSLSGSDWTKGDSGSSQNYTTNVVDKIVQWPDETDTNGMVTLEDGTKAWKMPKETMGYTYSPNQHEVSILDQIIAAWGGELKAQYGLKDLTADDIEYIYVIPYKISRYNGGDGKITDKHIDCEIRVVCKKAYVAKFLVQDAGASDYTEISTANYKILNNVPDPIPENNNQNYTATYPPTKTVDGVEYVFDGWYNEQDQKVSNWDNYVPNKGELSDGTVYFKAKYVVSSSVTTDDPYITVEKRFHGVTQDQIPEREFYIQVGTHKLYLNGATEHFEDAATGDIVYRWKIENVEEDRYDISEHNATIDGYDLTTSGNLGDSVSVTGKTFTAQVADDRIDSCANLDLDVGVHDGYNFIFVVSENGANKKNVVISKEPLSLSERKAVETAVKNAGSTFSSNRTTVFYSIRENPKITIDRTDIMYSGGQIHIGAECQWNHALQLKYSVTEGNNPEVTITNSYTSNRADLTVTKTVTGNMADLDEVFTFQMSIANAEINPEKITYKKGTTEEGKLSDLTDNKFTLKNGESIVFSGILKDAVVTVTETGAEDYKTTVNVSNTPTAEAVALAAETGSGDTKSGTVTISATAQTIAFTNTKEIPVNTGVILDTLPYVLMLIAVGGGVVAFFLRKRHHDDEE